ncbi:MAG: hypothetical protein Q9160_000778 [Pyrenula sp. 1 TL-2023]
MPQASGSLPAIPNSPAQTGVAPDPSSKDKTRAGVILSNKNDQPQTFYFIPNKSGDCTAQGSSGGDTPDAWITLTKEQGEVFIPRPVAYQGRIMRGPAPGSGPTPDLGLMRHASYAEIYMDTFQCANARDDDPYAQGFKAAGVTVSLNNGYDGPIYVHSDDKVASTDAQGDWGASDEPLWAGFKEDLFGTNPKQPTGVAMPPKRDGVQIGGIDSVPQGSMSLASGPWTNFYGAHLDKYTINLKVNYGGGTTAKAAYWGNAQTQVQMVYSHNYAVRVEFY